MRQHQQQQEMEKSMKTSHGTSQCTEEPRTTLLNTEILEKQEIEQNKKKVGVS